MVVFFFKAKFLIFLTAFEKKGGVCGVKIFDGEVKLVSLNCKVVTHGQQQNLGFLCVSPFGICKLCTAASRISATLLKLTSDPGKLASNIWGSSPEIVTITTNIAQRRNAIAFGVGCQPLHRLI